MGIKKRQPQQQQQQQQQKLYNYAKSRTTSNTISKKEDHDHSFFWCICVSFIVSVNPAQNFTVEHVQGVKLMDIQIHMRGYPYISSTRKRLRWFLKGHESQSVSGNDERLPPTGDISPCIGDCCSFPVRKCTITSITINGCCSRRRWRSCLACPMNLLWNLRVLPLSYAFFNYYKKWTVKTSRVHELFEMDGWHVYNLHKFFTLLE